MNASRPSLRKLFPLLGLVLPLAGCLQTKDELTLEPDGSGRVRLEVRTSLPREVLAQLSQGLENEGGKSRSFYPPLSEDETKRFFPEGTFGVKVTESKTETDRLLVVEATFKDVNALLASPYADAHSLVLRTNAGRLHLQALSGMEASALALDIKDISSMFGPGLSVLTAVKANRKPLHSEFIVALPDRASSTNGASHDRTVTWAVDGAVVTNHVELAQRLGAVLEASCQDALLKFVPVSPPRLNLARFADLQPGVSASQGKAPNAQEVIASARFVPHALYLARTLDLSGDGRGQGREAQLFASLFLPRAFKPERWGEPVIDEVIDSRGNSLKNEGETRNARSSYASVQSERDETTEPRDTEPAEERRNITLRFQPPEWKIPEISRLKGSISLHYSGKVRELLKLTNAVPAGWIKTVSKQEDMSFGDTLRPISDPALPALGLSLSLQMAMAQEGFTILMLQVAGQKAELSDLCVFDAAGRPWPTFFNGEQESQCMVMVAGRPNPPLSFALVATKSGGEILLPIQLENIPLHAAGK